ncbi:stage II sporulation protein R [Bacillus sp. T33-2]|uniref:stage II sporulation protein R n=1 Tax=Bacillus sp. T33-2 TaxID=2054168 RepID=UPI000C770E36|nr:stage II sporulation protein R [Bacillus sp. T33-2]PLR96611.1 stage II sporulation protein R [Bacillus sp. T33-2]
MKKNTAATLYLIILSIGTMLSLYIPKNEAIAEGSVVIPNEAIRLRILADSDAEQDQAIKRKVRDAVNREITKWVEDLTSIEDARSIIRSSLPQIQAIAEHVVKAEGSTQNVKAEFDRVQFPTKLYGQFLYPAGEYEAILITLGEGKGANWWCVLFPPLCFLDFSNGVAVSEGFEEEQPASQKKEAETPAAESEDMKKAADAGTGSPVTVKKKTSKQEGAKQPPVYEKNDEQSVEVRFFIADLWQKLK